MIKVFKFGLLPPTSNESLVNEQMYKAHKYNNKLIKIENDRRQSIREAASNINSNIDLLEKELEELNNSENILNKAIGKNHSINRSKTTSNEQKTNLSLIRTNINSKKKELSYARKGLKNDPALIKEYKKINDHAKTLVKAARANNGLYWGTGGLKDNAIEAASKKQPIYKDIHFKRWNGCGKIGIQIQTETGEEPTTISDIFNGKCSLIKINEVSSDIFLLSRKERRFKSRTKLYFRIGSLNKKNEIVSGGRTPMWAEFPMILHRDLPRNGIITNATVSRNSFASKEEWTLELTVKYDPILKKNSNSSYVAVDIGWRKINNEIRVATYVSSNGDIGGLCLPEILLKSLKKVDDIKGIRTKDFNSIKKELSEYVKLNNVSDWLKEEVKYLHTWKSINKLAGFVKKWGHNLKDSDRDIYDVMEKWRYKDFHLWNWECNQRRSSLRQRKDFYRNFAALLSSKYEKLIIEDFNLSNVSKKPSIDNNDGDNKIARANRQLSAVSELIDSFTLSFDKVNIIKVNPFNTSKMCNNCKSIEEIGSNLECVCSSCGNKYDRDENGALNILDLGMQAP